MSCWSRRQHVPGRHCARRRMACLSRAPTSSDVHSLCSSRGSRPYCHRFAHSVWDEMLTGSLGRRTAVVSGRSGGTYDPGCAGRLRRRQASIWCSSVSLETRKRRSGRAQDELLTQPLDGLEEPSVLVLVPWPLLKTPTNMVYPALTAVLVGAALQLRRNQAPVDVISLSHCRQMPWLAYGQRGRTGRRANFLTLLPSFGVQDAIFWLAPSPRRLARPRGAHCVLDWVW